MPDVDPPPAVATAPRQDLARLVLAEAVRLHEENHGFLIEDRAAEAAAVAAGGDLQRRIITRAGALTVAADVRDALDRLRQLFAFSSIAGFLIALALGAGSALALMASAPPGYGAALPTNFFLLYGSLLGPHALMLAAWLFALLVLPNRGSGSSLGGSSLGGGSLGGGILALVRRLSRWTLKQPLEAAAARAFALVMTGSPAGRWLVSALSHGLWFGYLAGCSAMVFLLLSTRQVNFAWETTILSAEDYIALTRALAAAPGWLGFASPDAQQIAASQIPLAAATSAAADRAWAGAPSVATGSIPRAPALPACRSASHRWHKRPASSMRMRTGQPQQPHLCPWAKRPRPTPQRPCPARRRSWATARLPSLPSSPSDRRAAGRCCLRGGRGLIAAASRTAPTVRACVPGWALPSARRGFWCWRARCSPRLIAASAPSLPNSRPRPARRWHCC